ncbi:YncE family protein [Amnibacterium kyonggiense]
MRTGYGGRPVVGAAEPGDAPVPTRAPAGRVVALPTGTHPWGVAVAPAFGRVYLAARHQDAFAVVDLRTRAVRRVAVPGSARMIDLVSSTGLLLLPAEDRATLYELALPSLDVVASYPTKRQPHQAVVTGNTTFVAQEYGHAVRVLRDGRRIADLPQPVQPGGITATAGRVAVVDVATATLFVYDATSLRLLTALPAGEGPSHVTPIGGSRVAVCDVRGNAILTYDLAGTPRRLGWAAVPGRAFWIVADQATGTIYTALANTNLVARLVTDRSGRPSLTGTIPTVQQPISMDLDAAGGTLYIGGYAASQLQIAPVRAFD